MSGISGELEHMDELLSSLKAETKDHADRYIEARKAAEEREAEDEHLGAAVCARVTSRRSRDGTELSKVFDKAPAGARTPRKHVHAEAFKDPLSDDITLSYNALKGSYKARHVLEAQQLVLERE